MSNISITKTSEMTGHKDCIYTLERCSDHTFFSSGGDGMVVLWDLLKPDQGELITQLDNSIYSLHYHQASNRLIVGHNYNGIHILDWESKKEISALHLGKSPIFDIKSIGNTLIIAMGNGEVFFVSLDTVRVIDKIKPTDKSARVIAIHPHEKEFAIGFSDHVFRIYSATTRTVLHEITSHTNSVFALAYSPQGNQLLSSGRDAHLKIWNTETHTIIDDIAAHMYAINGICFNNLGTSFATCSMDKTIKIWDAHSHKLLKVIDKSRHNGHKTSVNKLLWLAHQDALVSASDDRTISIWDIKRS